MQTSETLDQLATALAKAQGDIGKVKQTQEAIVPTKSGGQFRYNYATLGDVWEACRQPLVENGLSILQSASSDSTGVMVTTMLLHSSGQWVKDTLYIPVESMTAQAIGSAITYGRRYGLEAIAGVARDDDDGAEASKQAPRPRAERRAIVPSPRVEGSSPAMPTGPPPQTATCPEHGVAAQRYGSESAGWGYYHRLADGTPCRKPALEVLGAGADDTPD